MTSFENRIEGIVDLILEDYTHDRDIDRIDLFKHPDKDIIIDIDWPPFSNVWLCDWLGYFVLIKII